ncbi:MAG: hypothetical protein ACX93N_02935 [Pseudohaliea sp.]
MDGDATYEIRDGEAYRAAMNALNRRSQPPAVLRAIMNAFEAYRAARKIGWSRPWNKYGVRNFQSYRLDFTRDGELVADARAVLASPAFTQEGEARDFIDELLDDGPAAREKLMGFLFFHEADSREGLREGVMLSLGRVNEKRRHRDRLDLVFEADVDGDAVTPLRRVTVYVDPYRGKGPPLLEATVPAGEVAAAPDVFDRLKACYRDWGRDDPRLWDHWTSQYIDYFAPRVRPARQSHFPETPFEAAWRETRARH